MPKNHDQRWFLRKGFIEHDCIVLQGLAGLCLLGPSTWLRPERETVCLCHLPCFCWNIRGPNGGGFQRWLVWVDWPWRIWAPLSASTWRVALPRAPRHLCPVTCGISNPTKSEPQKTAGLGGVLDVIFFRVLPNHYPGIVITSFCKNMGYLQLFACHCFH